MVQIFPSLDRAKRQTPLIRFLRIIRASFRLFERRVVPRALFARSLIIIVAPFIILLAATTYVFMERHSQLVTKRLSLAVAGEIALLIDFIEMPKTKAYQPIFFSALERNESLTVKLLPGETIPTTRIDPTFALLNDTIEKAFLRKVDKPFWFDTSPPDDPSQVLILVQLDDAVLQVQVRRSRVLATNWHIFLVWVVGISIILMVIAIYFLRKQIRPIQRLAVAAQSFGMGRDFPGYRPSGAHEVRQAAISLIDMRNRLNRHIEQRTEMLAGVSHDMRTPLTRLRLQLAMMGDTPDIRDMKNDLIEMEHMLDEYLDFARGQEIEDTQNTDIRDLMTEIIEDAAREGHKVALHQAEDIVVPIRRIAFKRCIMNLVNNACVYGDKVETTVVRTHNNWVEVSIDDNGPGIPESNREEVFKPFHRLDEARNLANGGTGLGLSIALDIARSHGGEIDLETSELGGLKAIVRIPM